MPPQQHVLAFILRHGLYLLLASDLSTNSAGSFERKSISTHPTYQVPLIVLTEGTHPIINSDYITSDLQKQRP